MYTRWYSPRTVEQLVSDEVSWDGRILGEVVTEYTSLEPLNSVARSQGGVRQNGARSLVFRNFAIPDLGQIKSVEVLVFIERLARIQDRTVKLWNGEPIGKNRANLAAEDREIYGSDLAAFWKVAQPLTVSENFGVLIDLQPHTQYPCRDTVYLREVKIRVDFH